MDKTDMRNILSTFLATNEGIYSPLTVAKFIVFIKNDSRFTDGTDIRIKFDIENSLVYTAHCREVSTIPEGIEGEDFDYHNGKYYKYIKTSKGELMEDVYDLESLLMIELR